MAKGFVDALGARILRIPPFSKACQPPSLQGQPTHQTLSDHRYGAATTTMRVFVPWLQVLLDEERNLQKPSRNRPWSSHFETGFRHIYCQHTCIICIYIIYIYMFIFCIHSIQYIYIYIYVSSKKTQINAHLRDFCFLSSFSPHERNCTTFGIFALCAFWSQNYERIFPGNKRKYPGKKRKYPSIKKQMRVF